MEIDRDKPSRTVWTAGALVVLVAALGAGLGIRKLRTWQAESESEVAVETEVETVADKVEAGPIKNTVEAVEPVLVEAVEPQEEIEVAAEPEEVEEAEPQEERRTMGGAGIMGGQGERWQQMWADLNLTPEEQERLRAGFRLAMERFRSLPEEERQAEMQRFRDMREQWEGMSDEERDEAMGRMRDRFEDWRQSGEVELPPLTLD